MAEQILITEQPPEESPREGFWVRHKKKLTAILSVLLAVILVTALPLLIPAKTPALRYHKAKYLTFFGAYTKAYYLLQDCGEHEKSQKFLKDFLLLYTVQRIYPENSSNSPTYRTYDPKTKTFCRSYTNSYGQTIILESITYDQVGNAISTYDTSTGNGFQWDCQYDENRNLIKVINTKNYRSGDWYEYGYDEKGRRIREAHYFADGRCVYDLEYAYDEKGNQLSRVDHEDGTPVLEIENEYDDQGNLICKTDYTNQERHKYIYEYDNRGNMLSQIYYNKNGTVTSSYSYTYDDRGNLLCEIYYSSDGTINRKFQYTYDQKGNKVDEFLYYGSDDTTHRSYTYDKQGNMLSSSTFAEDGSIASQQIYTYDKKGNKTSEAFIKADGVESYRKEYTYDSHGNVTGMTQYDKGELARIEKYTDYRVVYVGK